MNLSVHVTTMIYNKIKDRVLITNTYKAEEVTMMVLSRQLVVVYLVLISVVSVKGECLGL